MLGIFLTTLIITCGVGAMVALGTGVGVYKKKKYNKIHAEEIKERKTQKANLKQQKKEEKLEKRSERKTLVGDALYSAKSKVMGNGYVRDSSKVTAKIPSDHAKEISYVNEEIKRIEEDLEDVETVGEKVKLEKKLQAQKNKRDTLVTKYGTGENIQNDEEFSPFN